MYPAPITAIPIGSFTRTASTSSASGLHASLYLDQRRIDRRQGRRERVIQRALRLLDAAGRDEVRRHLVHVLHVCVVDDRIEDVFFPDRLRQRLVLLALLGEERDDLVPVLR